MSDEFCGAVIGSAGVFLIGVGTDWNGWFIGGLLLLLWGNNLQFGRGA